MSKYNCIKCSSPANVIDFTKNSETTAVYANCKICNLDAWGGLDFHPAMNKVFNLKFSPNYNFKKTEGDLYQIIDLDL